VFAGCSAFLVLAQRLKLVILRGMTKRLFRFSWRSLTGLVFLLPSAWQSCRHLLDYAGYYDFYVSHAKEPGWVGTVLECLLNPPTWSLVPTIALGLVFIYWDTRNRHAESDVAVARPKVGSAERPPKELEKPVSNQQLATAVGQFSTILRTVNTLDNIRITHDVKDPEYIRLLGERFHPSDPAEKERVEKRIEHLRAMRPDLLEAHFNRRLAEFKAKYRSYAIVARNEMCSRTGWPVYDPNDPTRELMENNKIDEHSLEVLARYLTNMAERLPR